MREIKAVLLVGGLGTRLRSVVSSLPKALASVGGQPFLELLVRQLGHQGIRHLILCTGYLSEQIREVFQDGRSFGAAIEYSKEDIPMGTAGALKLAQRYVRHEPEFLVLNGDSFLEIDFNELLHSHQEHGGLATIAVTRVANASRYGTVRTGADGRVAGFLEKNGSNADGIINAGVYVFNKDVFGEIPEGPASLERDVFPRLLNKGVYAVEQQGIFIDIGTPADYARAEEICHRLVDVATHNT